MDKRTKIIGVCLENIKYLKNKIILNEFTNEENESFLFFQNNLNNFVDNFCKSILKINQFELTKPKILIGGDNNLLIFNLIKKNLEDFAIVSKTKQKNEFKIQVKQKYCTMGVYIYKNNNKIILDIIGANGIDLHAEQMSKLRFFCEN